ncbi:FxsB family radical SAM/SPASM domain protein [Streptosporangiaceae bacterium NEAU-GS5]|nr:FxsB family radical SAM/SPASM domain protein [Streptosporangiaceae bacterium NEAU-GS5]
MSANSDQGSRVRLPYPDSLDVGELLATGWRPLAFQQFILKVHSRCDLACRHCYIYEMADQSWRGQPRRMSPAIIERTGERIAEHARQHDLDTVEVILHGGEPLLAGADTISHVVRTTRGAMETGTRVNVGIQTNGVRLDEAYLSLLENLDIRVGVSFDGYEEAHDRHRRHADGRGSYSEVRVALQRLAGPYHAIFSGILCTIDIRNDPLATFEALLEFDPPAIDFLLPHGNWDAPPPFLDPRGAATPYADWLITIFDRWYGSSSHETEVRLFTEIMRLLAGKASRTESVGLSPVRMAVVETNGSIQQSDILKSSYHGAPETRLNVLSDPFDAALLLPSIAARQIGLDALSAACTACDLRAVCGGGQYAHRYSAAAGFGEPSVYCRDLYRLISHIRSRMTGDLARLRE